MMNKPFLKVRKRRFGFLIKRLSLSFPAQGPMLFYLFREASEFFLHVYEVKKEPFHPSPAISQGNLLLFALAFNILDQLYDFLTEFILLLNFPLQLYHLLIVAHINFEHFKELSDNFMILN